MKTDLDQLIELFKLNGRQIGYYSADEDVIENIDEEVSILREMAQAWLLDVDMLVDNSKCNALRATNKYRRWLIEEAQKDENGY